MILPFWNQAKFVKYLKAREIRDDGPGLPCTKPHAPQVMPLCLRPGRALELQANLLTSGAKKEGARHEAGVLLSRRGGEPAERLHRGISTDFLLLQLLLSLWSICNAVPLPSSVTKTVSGWHRFLYIDYSCPTPRDNTCHLPYRRNATAGAETEHEASPAF